MQVALTGRALLKAAAELALAVVEVGLPLLLANIGPGFVVAVGSGACSPSSSFSLSFSSYKNIYMSSADRLAKGCSASSHMSLHRPKISVILLIDRP